MTLYRRELTIQENLQVLAGIREMVARGDITLGDAVRVLRVGVLQLSRAEFARMVRVSQPALAQIETDRGNPTVETLRRIFGPFGMRVGLVQMVDRGRSERPTTVEESTYPALLEEVREVLARNRRG